MRRLPILGAALATLGALLVLASPVGAFLARLMPKEAFNRVILVLLALLAARLFWDVWQHMT